MSDTRLEVRTMTDILVVDVIGFSPVTFRFTMQPLDGTNRQEIILPMRAIMEIWPLISAALTLRGITP